MPKVLKPVSLYEPSDHTYHAMEVKANEESFTRSGLAQTFRTGVVTEATSMPAVVRYPQALFTR